MRVKRVIPWRYTVPVTLVLVLLLPRFLLPVHKANILAALILICAFSRTIPFYEKMALEMHSVITLITGHLLGLYAVILIAVLTTPLTFYLNPRFGNVPVPPTIFLDSIWLFLIGLIGIFTPFEKLVLWGILAIVVLNYVVLHMVRNIFSPEPIIKKFIVSMPAGVVNYMFLNMLIPYLSRVFA